MNKRVKQIIEAYTKEDDPLGSYSACPINDEHPVQDQDDL